ncbi:hypothetical protein ABZP36_027528 [Zizania latifolia]
MEKYRREEVTAIRKGRKDQVVTRTEITPSPHKDGYQWRKYGEKIIQNSNFSRRLVRKYFKCAFSRDRRCAAKKQVQRQDVGEPPVYLVTYLNEHTCQQAAPATPTTAGSSPTATGRRHSPPEVLASASRNGGAGLFGRTVLPHAVGDGGSAAEENAAKVMCLATVIGGAAPPPPTPPTPSFSWTPPAEASPSGLAVIVPAAAAAFVPSAGHSPSADGCVAEEAAEMDDCFPYDASMFSPVEAAADHHHLLISSGDVPLIGTVSSVWPSYTRPWS